MVELVTTINGVFLEEAFKIVNVQLLIRRARGIAYPV